MENTCAKIFVENVNIELSKIEYQSISANVENIDDVKTNVVQETKLIEVNADKLLLEVNRHILFEPSCFFDLNVIMIVTLYLKETVLNDNFDGNLELLEEYAKDKLSILSNGSGVGNMLSLLISQITSSCGRIPLVTPPNVDQELE